MTMTNCPGRAAFAMTGCRTSSRKVTSEKSSRATISKPEACPESGVEGGVCVPPSGLLLLALKTSLRRPVECGMAAILAGEP